MPRILSPRRSKSNCSHSFLYKTFPLFKMDLEACFKLMESPRPTSIPYMEEAIEQGGIRWDPRTGLEVGVVYVMNRTHYSHPSFSRYSRRSRFFSRLLDYVTCDRMVSAIMAVFDNILKAWKTKLPQCPLSLVPDNKTPRYSSSVFQTRLSARHETVQTSRKYV